MSEQQTWIKKRIGDIEYNNSILSLINIIPKNKYQLVYGIPRGGLIPAIWISYHLNIPLLSEYSIHDVPKDKVLVVDDIVDTGDTLIPFVESGYNTATLFYKSRSIVKPNFYIHQVDDLWVVFPYETDEEPINRDF